MRTQNRGKSHGIQTSMEKQASAHRDLAGRGSLRARTAGTLVAPKQDYLSSMGNVHITNTGPAGRGAGGLHEPSNTAASKRRAHEQG